MISGEQLRKRVDKALEDNDMLFKDLADTLGILEQALRQKFKAKDMGINFIHSLAQATNKDLSFFLETDEPNEVNEGAQVYGRQKSLTQRLLDCIDRREILFEENRRLYISKEQLYERFLSSEQDKIVILKQYISHIKPTE